MAFVTRHPSKPVPIVVSAWGDEQSTVMDRQDWYAVVTETSEMLEL